MNLSTEAAFPMPKGANGKTVHQQAKMQEGFTGFGITGKYLGRPHRSCSPRSPHVTLAMTKKGGDDAFLPPGSDSFPATLLNSESKEADEAFPIVKMESVCRGRPRERASWNEFGRAGSSPTVLQENIVAVIESTAFTPASPAPAKRQRLFRSLAVVRPTGKML